MNIIDFLRECKGLTTGVKSFAHGPRSYSNLESENEIWGKEFPRIWVYPVESVDTVQANGRLARVHRVMLDVNDLIALEAGKDDLETKLKLMDALSTEFEYRVAKHPSLRMPKDMQLKFNRAPEYHYNDANLCGWMINFTIVIDDALEYPCP